MPLKQCSRDEFIENNLGLVHACANRFRGRGIEYDDLYSAGCMGLVKAYDAFDEERGVQFSTYAVPVILGEIKKLFRDGGSVKVSRSLKELSLKINAARDTLQKKTGAQPTVGELAAYLQVSPEPVSYTHLRRPASSWSWPPPAPRPCWATPRWRSTGRTRAISTCTAAM